MPLWAVICFQEADEDVTVFHLVVISFECPSSRREEEEDEKEEEDEEEEDEEEEEEEEEEKIPLCESIGHRPLRGRCPAPPSTSTTTYLSRARVPLTI